MVNTNKLRGIMAEHGKTYKDMADVLHISRKTFGIRMRDKKFNSTEMKLLIDYFNIDDPNGIFFD